MTLVWMFVLTFILGGTSVVALAYVWEATDNFRYHRRENKKLQSRPEVPWEVSFIEITRNREEGSWSHYRWFATAADKNRDEVLSGYGNHPVDAVIGALRGEELDL